MKQEELQETLGKHSLWLGNKEGGQRANLRYANLRDANLRDANLSGADLSGANLRYADLSDANLSDANLSDANLSDADLSYADLSYANLSYANLSYAGLSYANLRGANLRGANLRDANLSGADLSGADLSGVDFWSTTGNMSEVKSISIDTWVVTYTPDTLQIGCQQHSIEKWSKWDTEAGRRWVSLMDERALGWADKYLDHVLKTIELSPAKPTGKETK